MTVTHPRSISHCKLRTDEKCRNASRQSCACYTDWWIRFLTNQALAQLEERGLVENLGEAVGNLVARADEVRLDRAVKLALAE
eukprot:6206468-Pleurochrysis_carterae.AAC.1